MKFKYTILTILVVFGGFAAAQIGIAQVAGSDDVVPAYNPPAVQNLAPVVLPPISEKMLKNGLKVVVVEHHELPVVTLRLVLRTGSIFDPSDKAGLTQFMTGLLTMGTEKYTATEIADKIDFVGGSISAGSSWDASWVECNVLIKHLKTAEELMSQVVLHAKFPNDEIDRMRQQILSGIERSKDNAGAIVGKFYNQELYGTHPYAMPNEGTEESVKAITRGDIVSQYLKVLTPDKSLLYISGDISAKDGLQIAERLFNNWKGAPLAKASFPIPPQPKATRIILVDKPDATQSQIRFGYPGISRDNVDYFPVTMMNYIFGGGGFVSRLTKVVRSEMGLTYGISSSFSARLQPGPFTVSTFTKNKSTLDAIQASIKLMKEYQDEGPTDQELSEAKSYMTGSYPLNFETPNQIAGNLQSIEIYNLGSDYIQKYRSRINAITKQDVINAAKKYLHPDNLVIVVVAKASDVKTDLEKLGPLTVIPIE
jgi:zinc protease